MPNDESAIQPADDSVDALPFSTDSNTESDETQNSGDNIITISTTTIISRPLSVEESGDTNSSERTIKEHNITTSERIVQFLSKKPVAPAAAASQTPNRPNEEPPRKRNFSRCISFQDNIADVHHRKGRRLHGLQLPLHPLQIFGWLVLILFGFASYYLLIPSFTADIQGPLYGLITGLYIVHVVSHVTALLTDPADRELRRVHRNDRIVPEFDRSKHTHVIENGRCHLCNIRTSSQRTKHCSVCNKCVGKFDHHCKWLNHCIGSRNYVAFLMCVVSAVIATLVIVAAVIARIALYYMQPEWFSLWHPAVSGDNVSSEESVAFVLANDSLATTATDLEFISLGAAANNTLNLMNATLTDESELFGNMSSVTPSLIDNVTALVTEAVNETMLLVNLTTSDLVTAPPPLEPSAAATTVVAANSTTIGGIGINDTIFLVLIGFLGLLAAITAGLLLHLCFFHIYISFLGLTTYEYIRNHRQAQEAKAKSLLATAALPSDGQPHRSSSRLHPSGKSVDCGQIYFCSRLRNPNANDLRYCEARKSDEERQKDGGGGGGLAAALHCCANSREYHQTALKTYYMCSLLEEGATTATNGLPTAISHISGNSDGPNPSVEAFYGNYDPEAADTDASDTVRTFHCCSTFAATTTQRRVSAATTKATLVTDLESAAATLSGRRSYLKYTEQCTFCTFRIRRSPIVAKRSASAGTNATMRSSATRTLRTEVSQSSSSATSRNAPAGLGGGGIENQRCCMKAISKHQRWRRKWNCCANVPDSPDVPTDIIASLAMSHGPQSAGGVAAKNLNATEIPVHFIKTINNGLTTTTTTTSSSATSSPSLQRQSRPTSPRGSHLKAQGRVRNGHNWPLARFRHLLRMLSRHRRTRCQHQCDERGGENVAAGGGVGVGDQVKQNQVRPLQFQNDNNGLCFHHQLQQQRLQQAQQHPQGQNYYDSSSPQPPSSTTTERSSDPEMFSDSSNLPTPNNAVEHMLPTTVIRDDTSMTYTSLPPILTLPPALPPPTRRKIPNPTDLEELAETLSFASNPSSGFIAGSGGQRLPALNNIYRRQRRKHFLRTRSPTLSPIHESGLSNPTSPQPGRHATTTSTTTSPVSCSPSTGRIVNNLCVPNSEQARKMGSNTSLHSVSSNSSST